MNLSGTVIDESGTPIGGATVSLSPAGGSASTAVTDTNGRYALALPATADFGGHADKAGYDSTWRDAYFAAGPGILNFRLFRTLRIADADSAHVMVTTDGSVCGIDDEWLCRTVRVSASRAGTLDVQGIADDPSIRPLIGIGEVGYACCPAPSSVVVSAGAEVLVYIQLAWNGRGTGVTLRTSIH
jgi:hypothetical protein